MNELEALILGLIQGLTEYLPVSSSGHLTIGQEVLGVSGSDNLIFDVVKPYGCNTEDDEIKHILSDNIKRQEPDINCVITVEPPFC